MYSDLLTCGWYLMAKITSVTPTALELQSDQQHIQSQFFRYKKDDKKACAVTNLVQDHRLVGKESRSDLGMLRVNGLKLVSKPPTSTSAFMVGDPEMLPLSKPVELVQSVSFKDEARKHCVSGFRIFKIFKQALMGRCAS